MYLYMFRGLFCLTFKENYLIKSIMQNLVLFLSFVLQIWIEANVHRIHLTRGVSSLLGIEQTIASIMDNIISNISSDITNWFCKPFTCGRQYGLNFFLFQIYLQHYNVTYNSQFACSPKLIFAIVERSLSCKRFECHRYDNRICWIVATVLSAWTFFITNVTCTRMFLIR